jgi:hypothetical protein
MNSFIVTFIFVHVYVTKHLLYMKMSHTDYSKIPRPTQISCTIQNTHLAMTLFATFSKRQGYQSPLYLRKVLFFGPKISVRSDYVTICGRVRVFVNFLFLKTFVYFNDNKI